MQASLKSHIRRDTECHLRTLENHTGQISALNWRTHLLLRRIFGKCPQRLVPCNHAIDDRNIRCRDLQNPHHRNDAGEADVGDRWCIAVTVSTRFRLQRQTLFDSLQAGREQVDLPGAQAASTTLLVPVKYFCTCGVISDEPRSYALVLSRLKRSSGRILLAS